MKITKIYAELYHSVCADLALPVPIKDGEKDEFVQEVLETGIELVDNVPVTVSLPTEHGKPFVMTFIMSGTELEIEYDQEDEYFWRFSSIEAIG